MALNMEKMTSEFKEYFKCLVNPPKASHEDGIWMNRFVEAARLSPYASGHIDAVVFPLIFIVSILLWWKW